uniref:Uncharacterized protein n=1 Tax=Bionectria ochroleuca TaxID=29856 RepID=A0A8H7N1P7_BIOOC
MTTGSSEGKRWPSDDGPRRCDDGSRKRLRRWDLNRQGEERTTAGLEWSQDASAPGCAAPAASEAERVERAPSQCAGW